MQMPHVIIAGIEVYLSSQHQTSCALSRSIPDRIVGSWWNALSAPILISCRSQIESTFWRFYVHQLLCGIHCRLSGQILPINWDIPKRVILVTQTINAPPGLSNPCLGPDSTIHITCIISTSGNPQLHPSHWARASYPVCCTPSVAPSPISGAMECSKRFVAMSICVLVVVGFAAEVNAQCSLSALAPCYGAVQGAYPPRPKGGRNGACCRAVMVANPACLCSQMQQGRYPQNMIRNAFAMPRVCGRTNLKGYKCGSKCELLISMYYALLSLASWLDICDDGNLVQFLLLCL